MSQYIRFRGSVGYTDYAPEAGQPTNSVSDFTGIYAQLDVQHQLDQFLDYTLSRGRSISCAPNYRF